MQAIEVVLPGFRTRHILFFFATFIVDPIVIVDRCTKKTPTPKPMMTKQVLNESTTLR